MTQLAPSRTAGHAALGAGRVRTLPRQRAGAGAAGGGAAGGGAAGGGATRSGAAGGVAGLDAAALLAAAAATGLAWQAAAACAAATLCLLAGGGRYRLRITLRLGDELPGIAVCAALPALLLATPGYALAAVAGLAVGRSVSYAALRAARRRGLLGERTLLVGAGKLGCEVAGILAAHPELGLRAYGFVDGRPSARPTPLPWLGDVTALPQLVAAHRIRRVLVCFPRTSDAALVPALRAVTGARISLVPRLYELGRDGPASSRDEVWGIPLMALRRPGPAGRIVKRALDVLVAAALLVALAPLWAVLALAAKAASGGSALFRQTRVTGAGRTARILKLRTLPPDPDGDAATDTRWAVPEERCTRLGRLLRASHADELPQLVNVLRGEMSLVGPRPERPYFAALFAEQFPGYAARHRMPAGMTGWAQVHGLCGDTSVAERARFDNRYVADWTLWTDLVILARTLTTVFPWRGGRA